jgi:electron transport complex protein RnfG
VNKLPVALRLFIITAVSALLLAVVNSFTSEITIKNQQKAFNEALADALPDAKEFKSMDWKYKNDTVSIDSIHEGYSDKECKDFKGYVVKATSSEGYGGKLSVIVGIDKNFNVKKVLISSPFAETPGLGAKAKEPDFLNQFKGKSGELGVVKREANNDSEIEAISSATITSKAVTSCVNAALEAVRENPKKDDKNAKNVEEIVKEVELQSAEEKKAAEDSHKDESTPIIAGEESEGAE